MRRSDTEKERLEDDLVQECPSSMLLFPTTRNMASGKTVERDKLPAPKPPAQSKQILGFSDGNVSLAKHLRLQSLLLRCHH